MTIEILVTLYYGHVDNPLPISQWPVMGRVICDLYHMPWKKYPHCPLGFEYRHYEDHPLFKELKTKGG